MQSADASSGPWPPPSPGAPADPVPTPVDGADGDRRVMLICAVLVVIVVVASLVSIAVRAARGGGERAVVPVRQQPPTSTPGPGGSAPTTVAPGTTAAPATTATTAVATTAVATTAPTTSAPTTVRPTTAPTTTVPTAPPTTVPPTTVPPTTVPPPTSVPSTAVVTPATVPSATVLGAGGETPEAQAALEDARTIAAALVDGDWAEARRLGPTDRRRTDAQLEAGYGAATDVTLLPARVTDMGRRTDLRLGLVAHEEHATGPATAVMCVHWRVDNTTRAVERVSSVRLRLEPGLTDPALVADELLATCAHYPLR